ncbi:YflJ family protein [Aeribacillus pallidus]|jgi:hypothetical protein|uniref:YflJ family protein n=1 Tax=Aeribacillus pallidus TaxID=33936 RepID=UPI001E10E648|nr:YflJ family protein [Bacillus sp. (in: firmicutes)]
MAFKYSKGWFVQQLKEAGVRNHPQDFRKIELYKTPILRQLYAQYVNEGRQAKNESTE